MTEIDFFKIQVKVVTYENIMEVAEFLSKKTGLRVDNLSGLSNGLFVRVNRTNEWVSNFYESDNHQTINYEQFKEQIMERLPKTEQKYPMPPVKEPVKEPVKSAYEGILHEEVEISLVKADGCVIAKVSIVCGKYEVPWIIERASSDELRAIADYLDSKNNQ